MRPMPAHRSPRRRPHYLRRRILAAVVAVVALAGAGVGIAAAISSVDHQGSKTAGGTSRASSSPTTAPPPPTTVPPPRPNEPGGGRRLFPGRRIVAFYGAPGGSSLGILGAATPAATWPVLRAQAASYAEPGIAVLPAYELITYVAQSSPGPSGSYSARLPDAEIRQYLSVVRAHAGMLILDIQPGRGSMLADARTLAPYLDHADVGLALDPEWEVAAPQLPGQVIGHTTAGEINRLSRWLNRFTAAHHLPQKLLLIHQFTSGMVLNKAAMERRYHLALVFNMDGFGGWANKVSVYHSLATDHRWRLGFKLFYHQDAPLYPPSAVLALRPSPSVVEYE
jgi:hypothetical protein